MASKYDPPSKPSFSGSEFSLVPCLHDTGMSENITMIRLIYVSRYQLALVYTLPSLFRPS